MNTFTLNGTTYQTDTETLNVLRSIMTSAKTTGDSSAVIAVIELGKMTGRITEVKDDDSGILFVTAEEEESLRLLSFEMYEHHYGRAGKRLG